MVGFRATDGTLLNVNSAGEGSPVVFQHGLCGDSGQTTEAFPIVPGFRRITVEARGHGQSEPGDLRKHSIATFTDDLISFVEEKLDAPIVVGGISMGAAMALRLAVKRPDLVRAVILARPAWVTNAAPENMRSNLEAGRLLERLPPAEARAAFLESEIGRRLATEAPDNLTSATGFFSREPVEVTAALLTSISNDGPGVSEGELERIAVPVLVIGHQRDIVHPIDYARALAQRIPAARFVEITPKAENKAQYIADFHNALRTFLKEL